VSISAHPANWYKVTVVSTGTRGYVFAKYITLISATPTPTATPTTDADCNANYSARR
jgi:hypothetical protein